LANKTRFEKITPFDAVEKNNIISQSINQNTLNIVRYVINKSEAHNGRDYANIKQFSFLHATHFVLARIRYRNSVCLSVLPAFSWAARASHVDHVTGLTYARTPQYPSEITFFFYFGRPY